VDGEIEKQFDTFTGANQTLLSYANSKIEELDTKRQSLTKAIADMKISALSSEHANSISDYLTDWDNVSFDDKRLVLDGLVTRITATSENVQIEWKIKGLELVYYTRNGFCTLYNTVDGGAPSVRDC